MQLALYSEAELEEYKRPVSNVSTALLSHWRKSQRKMKKAIRRIKSSGATVISQLSFLDILTMSDEELGPVVWTDDDIDILREQVLKEAIHVLLDGRAGLSTRKDRWEWIMSDDFTPFSFHACAQAAGTHWEELRESLITLCRRAKVLHTLAA